MKHARFALAPQKRVIIFYRQKKVSNDCEDWINTSIEDLLFRYFKGLPSVTVFAVKLEQKTDVGRRYGLGCCRVVRSVT